MKKENAVTKEEAMNPETVNPQSLAEKPEAPKLAVYTGPQRGFEDGVDNDDLIIPRAAVMQATSPELKDKALCKAMDIGFGSIINSLTKEPLGEEFIPVFMFKNWVRFNPRESDDPAYDANFGPGEVIWKSNDPLDPKVQEQSKFGPNGEKPLATTFINFFCYFPGTAMPMIVSFAKTSYRAGKELISLVRFSGGDMFSKKYRLTTDTVDNAKGTFAVLKVQPSGAASPEEYKYCENLWETYSKKARNIKVHDMESEGAEDEPKGRPY